MRNRRAWLLALAVLALALVGARAYAPVALQRYVNRTLDRADGYDGRIGDVDLNLLRGAYEIEDVEIVKDKGNARVPLFKAPLVDLSIEWRALFDGSVVAELWLDHPEVNFVAGPAQDRQSGVETDWRDVVKKLMPVKFNRVTARDGRVHFRSFRSDPPFDVYIDDVQLVVNNLTNSEDLSEDMVARASFSGIPMQSGRVKAELSIDPYADAPTFDLNAQLVGLALENFNDFFRAFAGIDVQRGSLRLFAELQAKEGSFQGYIKPFFEDVDVLAEEEVEEQGFLASVWEAIVGGATEALQDQAEDRVATRIPIAGTVSSPDIGFWRTLGNVLRNAFLQAFVPSLEHSVGEER